MNKIVGGSVWLEDRSVRESKRVVENRGEPFSLSRKLTSNFTMMTDERDII